MSDIEKFFEQIISHIPISILVFDSSLKVVYVNENFLEKTRLKRGQVMGKQAEDIFPPVLLKYSQIPDLLRWTFREGHAVPGREMIYRSPGIPYRVYYYSLNPLKGEKGIEHVMLLMEDITEQTRLREEVRKTERHLASVVESANDIVVSMDPYGIITTWNTAGEKITELSAQELIGRHITSLCATGEDENLRQALISTTEAGKVKNIEVKIKTKRGKEIPVAWNFSSMRDGGSKLVGLAAIGRDLTETKQLQGQLIQSAKLASLGVLAGGIAHELRNPLGITSAAAQLFLERPDDPEFLKECAQRIYTGIQRASEIIEGLLKFARHSPGQHEPTDINKILEETLTLIGKQLTTQQITVHRDLYPSLPLIKADGKLLNQVFLNIIINASNAMPKGGHLWIKTELEQRHMTAALKIVVKDNGVGIPKEHIDKIFDPFFSTMPVGKGTGLGLSICYGIVKEHGGEIKVESTEGEGSTFTILLPVTKRI
ncbi:MAG TPA: PAS domain S-box protein [Candidatus Hypogeohydataceae bacterium YC41]